MRIDSHQHVWALARGDYGWLTPDLAPIYRDVSLADLRPHLRANGFGGTILVQAAPTVAETEYLLGLADGADWVLGVVGWVDLDAPSAADEIRRLAAHPKLVGLRPMIHDIADDDWMLRPSLAPGLAAMVETGLRFDALVRPRHLGRLRRFRDAHPDLRIVIDHCAKPEIAAGAFDGWATDMARLAGETDMLCKLSGLATEAGPDWREADLVPYLDHVLEVFGTDRLMFGSDWPVLELAGAYDGWAAIAARAVAPHGPAAEAAVFGGTAAGFYLDRG